MILHVRACDAKDVPKMDVGTGTCDPFLVFKLRSKPNERHKTKVIKKTYEPVWNEEFHFPIKKGVDEVLHVELKDWDRLSANDLISTRDFEINSFQLGKVIDWRDSFFVAPKVEKPGRVHLIFHLANEGDEPFKEKVLENHYSHINLVINPLTQTEIQDAREQFAQIDKDGNGVLDENELDYYFKSSKAELSCFSKLIIEIYGKNGGVSIDQFLQFYKSFAAPRDSDDYIGRHIFDYIDNDHSGTIEASEFQKVVDLIKFPEGTKQDTIDRVDQMDYEEFSKRFYTLLKMAWKGLVQRSMYNF